MTNLDDIYLKRIKGVLIIQLNAHFIKKISVLKYIFGNNSKNNSCRSINKTSPKKIFRKNTVACWVPKIYKNATIAFPVFHSEITGYLFHLNISGKDTNVLQL